MGNEEKTVQEQETIEKDRRSFTRQTVMRGFLPCLVIAFLTSSILCAVSVHIIPSWQKITRYILPVITLLLFLLFMLKLGIRSPGGCSLYSQESAEDSAEREYPVKLKRVNSIDGLRGILALTIALFHFGQAYGMGNVFHRGWLAVEVFFLISGFLLANKLEVKGRKLSLVKSINQRLIQLYPMYFISVILLVMLYSATWFSWNPVAWINSDSGHFKQLVAELLCVQVTGISGLIYINGPIWYVSALLLSTVAIISAYQVFSPKVFKAIIIASTAVIYALFFAVDPSMNSAGYFMGTRLPSPLLRGIAGVGLGCCLYWIYLRFAEKAKQSVYLNIIAVEMCVVTVFHLIWTEPGRSNFLVLVPASIAILTMFWIGNEGKFLVLNAKPVQYLGKISYTFFVLQSFSQNFVSIYVSPHVSNHYLLNLFFVVFNLLLSAILYPVFENGLSRRLLKAYNKKRVDSI